MACAKWDRWFMTVMAAAIVAAAPAWGQSAATTQAEGPRVSSGRSDTAYARELLRLNQPAALRAAAEEAKGTPAAKMYRAQEIVAGWKEARKNRVALGQLGREYVQNLTDYLAGKPADVDGRWALDQAKFIFGEVSEPIINRMEYWANGPKDRKTLGPIAALADALLKTASEKLQAQLAAMETDAERRNYPSEEAYTKAYMALYDAKSETDYYQAWGQYFLALAMEPRDPKRLELLSAAAKSLKEWADGPDDSGVKYQSLLLRGKIYSEARRIAEAVQDLTAAAAAKDEPGRDLGWVRYQAHYQLVVAQMRGRDFSVAAAELRRFDNWIINQGGATEAKVSAQMLTYRLAWAEADTLSDKAEPHAVSPRQAKRAEAMKLLEQILNVDPKYRELVFDQLAAQVSDDDKLEILEPLQALAVAWSLAQTPDEPRDAMRSALSRACDAAQLVRGSAAATPAEKREATLIKAVASARLNQLQDAASLNLEFIAMAPNDPRVKDLVNLVLGQLGQLRKEGMNTPEIQTLTQKALDLATEKFNDHRWLLARGAMLLEQHKTAEARAVFEQITRDEPAYFDAQYQLILVSVEEKARLAREGAPVDQQLAAAQGVLQACTHYLDLLADQPAETRKRMLPTLVDLRLVQISTALSPLDDARAALAGIDALVKEADQNNIALSPQQKAGVLRYRIIALARLGESQKVAGEIRKIDPAQAPELIKNLVRDNAVEIEGIEDADPKRARELAGTVAELLDTLISLTKSPKDIYAYQQWRADMLLRAGKTEESRNLWVKLQSEDNNEAQIHGNQDLLNYMGEARAMFAAKEYAKAEDLFGRTLQKLPVGSESYWEAYLRMIQCREVMGKNMDDVKRRLRDLKVGDPDHFGGTTYRRDFQKLADKYGV